MAERGQQGLTGGVRPSETSRIVQPLAGAPTDYDALIDRVGDARIVMIGEASHGTAEFYAVRAALTRRLIEERGFDFVAVEGDWPDSYRVNEYVRGGPGTALEALAGFRRFPTWMWRNTVVLEFIRWLRALNEDRASDRQVGFYGLDVYSLHASIAEVLRYWRHVDPMTAAEAARRYGCFDPFEEDTQHYALSASFRATSCEAEVIENLLALQRERARYEAASGAEAFFRAEINALAVRDAEAYYRQMVRGGSVTWNLRDTHMVEVLDRLMQRIGPTAKAILWEHNTHIGDFRATYEGRGGHVNVGQLVRERWGDTAIAIGFGTHRGSVTAASAWDMPAEFKRVPPARAGSYEDLFHQGGVPNFYLDLKHLAPTDASTRWLFETRDERAIGVVYDPERERFGNYVPSQLARRYDAYLFFDETLAIEPLDPGPEPAGLETYPSGF